MDDKLNSILNNPQLMQQIMTMAQSLGQSSPQNEESAAAPPPNLDRGMISRIAAFAGQSGTTQDEQTLLSALSPYLRRDRIAKLEKAMRAAKMAKFASGFLNAGGLQLLTGR